MQLKEAVQIGGLGFVPFLSEEQIKQRVTELGKSISENHQGQDVLLVGVLKGCFVFMADLARCIEGNVEVAFIRASSYKGTQSTGQVKLDLMGLDVAGKSVVLIEDIIDTGRTLTFVQQQLQQLGARQVKVATLLLKPESLQVSLQPDWTGFEIEDRFVIGYGMDYNERGRQLPGIFILEDK